MAKKPSITTVATGYNATDTVNDNFTNIRNAFDNTLSLDGSTPNALQTDLDLNGNDIINGGTLYVDNIVYGNEPLPVVNGGTGASTAAGARTNLGLGTMATETASNYLTTSSAASTYLSQSSASSTYLTQANASSTYLTQSNASSTYLTQTNAASTYQPLDADLTSIAGLTGEGYLTRIGGAYALSTESFQPLDADLTAIGALSKTDGNFIVANGTTWVAESGSTARTSLGLGTAATADSTDFAAASHTHIASAITDFSEAVDDRVNGLLVGGTGVTLTYNDLAGSLTIDVSAGTGDVTGPASATANNFASFNGTTGKIIKDSTYSPSSFAAAVHTHAISDVTGLQTALDGKQPLDADLTTLGGLAKTDGNFIVGDGTNWVVESGATARTSLGLGTMATETASNYLTTSSAASTYQPLDADLTALGGLAKTDGNFIVGNGTTWIVESGDTARTSLGVGTGDTPTFTNMALSSTDAGASAGPYIDLWRNSASPAANDVIGVIYFSGEDSASNWTQYADIVGTIDDPTNGSEDGSLLFRTLKAGTLTDSLEISSGYVAINTIPQSYAQLRMKNDRAATTYAYVSDTYNGATFENSYVQGFDGSRTFLGNYQNFPLAFLTNNSEAMRITTSGAVLVGRTTDITFSSTTDVGHVLSANGQAVHFRSSNAPLVVGRQTDDGNVVNIYQGGTLEGSISVSGTTVTYGSFSGSHWSQLSDNSRPNLLAGTVVESIDEKCQWPGEENDQLAKFKVSDTVASKRVYGVFMAWDNDDMEANDAYITGIGAYVVRVAAGVTVNGGDLLESNGDGCARVQADDIIRSSTIAKVTCNIPTETYPDGSYTVPCVLYCG